MTKRPTRIAQTTAEVKEEYKKHGPRLREHELRRLQRGVELDERADKLRKQNEQRRVAKRKREAKARKEREARHQLGVGLATQMVGYSHTQAKMKSGMEAFLGLSKRKTGENGRQADVDETPESVPDTVVKGTAEKDPWDDDDDDDVAFDPVPDLETGGADSLMDDDLDDNTLLEAHNLCMPDWAEAVLHNPAERACSPPRVVEKPVVGHVDFLRLHGPINKALEKTLAQFPEPLIELLSLDCSTNQPVWAPPPSLLYKLSPAGLPPHRLRVKVGCVLSLLHHLNTDSGQPSNSNHVRILRVENDRLECIVLDGQLEGTKTILTRVPFHAKYKNSDQFPFQRVQFPVRVSTDFTPPRLHRDTSRTASKAPSMSERPAQPAGTSKKPALPFLQRKPSANRNPEFKLPGLPASNPIKPLSIRLDEWDVFLDSPTQIARELSSDEQVMRPMKPVSMESSSPDDLGFTLEDLEEAANLVPALPERSLHTGLEGNASMATPAAQARPCSAAVEMHTVERDNPRKAMKSAEHSNKPAPPFKTNAQRGGPSHAHVNKARHGRSEIPQRGHPNSPQHAQSLPSKVPFVLLQSTDPNPLPKHEGCAGDLGLSTQFLASFFNDDDLD